MFDFSANGESVVISVAGRFGDDEAVLQWKRDRTQVGSKELFITLECSASDLAIAPFPVSLQENMWTNEPMLEVCPETNTPRRPSYVRTQSLMRSRSTSTAKSLSDDALWRGNSLMCVTAHGWLNLRFTLPNFGSMSRCELLWEAESWTCEVIWHGSVAQMETDLKTLWKFLAFIWCLALREEHLRICLRELDVFTAEYLCLKLHCAYSSPHGGWL